MDISNIKTRIRIDVFKDMKHRVEIFKRKNKRSPRIVYLNPRMKTDYVTIERYEDMLKRYKEYLMKNGRDPEYIYTIKEPTPIPTAKKGYWVRSDSVNQLKPDIIRKMKNDGCGILLINSRVLELFGGKEKIKMIQSAGVEVHGWVQCLKYDESGWKRPDDTNVLNRTITIVKDLVTAGVDGIHFDYIRYPGDAYKYPNASMQIVNFINKVKKAIRPFKKDVFYSAAVMPECEANAYYYGQDYQMLDMILSAVVPMVYKHNYREDVEWIGRTTRYIRDKLKNSQLWVGLQTYKGDTNPVALSREELDSDIETAFDNGADKVMLFRYGLTP